METQALHQIPNFEIEKVMGILKPL